MPVITLDALKKEQDTKVYLYRDVQLDIVDNNIINDVGLFGDGNTTDIGVSYDEAAIKNSLINLFSTMPGQKILNPGYGLNLSQFLFIPASETMARMIGNRILEGIETFEPRVTVESVNVMVDEEAAEYTIDLALKIPRLSNSTVRFTGILQQPGFSFL